MAKSLTVPIKGMHCRSCELLVEGELCEIPNVNAARVDHHRGVAEIRYSGQIDEHDVAQAVQNAGYEVGTTQVLPLITSNSQTWKQLSIAAMSLLSIYFVVAVFKVGTVGSFVPNTYSSLPVVFLIGLTAGVSTCMALVGGLVLGVASKYAKLYPDASALAKFQPHLVFNASRIVSFFIFGALIGWLGSLLQISLTTTGLLTIVVGLSMLLLGLQLLDIFPRLSDWQLTVPKDLARFLGLDAARQQAYSHRGAITLGALTFFLPCGFTQAIQLYAMSTGSPLTGALTMGVFALGTAPGLLAVGGFTSLVKGQLSQYFFKCAGLIVIVLAIYNIANGLNLTGLLASVAVPNQDISNQVDVVNPGEVQVLKGTYTVADDVQPQTFTVKVGQPARIEILAEENGYGCMGSFALPGLSKDVKVFEEGATMVMEFTPTRPGTYQMTCAMGIPHGTIIVKS